MSMTLPAVAPRVAPRLHSVAPYADTSGYEALDLAGQAGLIADDWQRQVIVDALGERPDGRWSSFEVGLIVGRQNGKGSVLEIRALAGLVLFGEQLQLWSAHETKTAFQAFARMESLVENYDDLRRRVRAVNRSTGREGIKFTNGSELRFIARSKGSGRGFSADLIILDEAYALTEEHVDAMLPTMAARPNPQVWYTSSPPLDSMSGEKLFQLRRRARAGDPGLCYYDYGLQGVDLDDLSDVDLDDPALWESTNPAWGVRITEEFCRKERGALSVPGFARERLGIWPAEPQDGNAEIPTALWESLKDVDSQASALTFALDVTPERDYAAIVACGTRPDGLLHWEVVDHAPGVDWVVRRATQLKAGHRPVALVVDGRSPAASLVPDLLKAGFHKATPGADPEYGDLVVTSAQDMADAFGMLIDACRQSRGRHIDQWELSAALACAGTRPLGDGGKAWTRKSLGDIAPLVGLTLASWGHETRAHLVTRDYDLLNSVW